MVARLKLVLSGSFSLENWRIHRVQNEIILRPREVEEAQAVDMALVLGRNGDLFYSQYWQHIPLRYGTISYPMHCRLDVASRQKAESVAGVHGQAPIKGLCPLPLTGLVVLDLQSSHRLPEEQSDCSEISVTEGPQAVTQPLELFGGEL